MRSMKVHQLARGLMRWEHEPPSQLSLGFKRLRPLAPKLVPTSLEDLKSFIRPQKLASSDVAKDPSPPPSKPQVETHPGGTRWNPTQEQIGILEMLYRGGMRTPNAQQIEQITAQLSKFGKIEGKNVFYWFQNHKARERQKQKRSSASLGFSQYSPSPRSSASEEESPYKYKRKCRSWAFDWLEEESRSCSWSCKDKEDTTLELFPLRPERPMKEFDSFKC